MRYKLQAVETILQDLEKRHESLKARVDLCASREQLKETRKNIDRLPTMAIIKEIEQTLA